MALRRVIPLDGKDTWVFRQASNASSEWLNVRGMPTNVHLDLLLHGLISDPHSGTQENDCQWVGEETWVYRGSFSRPDGISNGRTLLAFDGLDTYVSDLKSAFVCLWRGVEPGQLLEMWMLEWPDFQLICTSQLRTAGLTLS